MENEEKKFFKTSVPALIANVSPTEVWSLQNCCEACCEVSVVYSGCMLRFSGENGRCCDCCDACCEVTVVCSGCMLRFSGDDDGECKEVSDVLESLDE